jgi:hypothetical protein
MRPKPLTVEKGCRDPSAETTGRDAGVQFLDKAQLVTPTHDLQLNHNHVITRLPENAWLVFYQNIPSHD